MANFDQQYPREWGPRVNTMQACPAHAISDPNVRQCRVCEGRGTVTVEVLNRYVTMVNQATEIASHT